MYFRGEYLSNSKSIIQAMEKFEQSKKEKTKEQSQQYLRLLNQLVHNASMIYKNVQEHRDNQELIEHICEVKNIDLSYESYKRWLETGEKIKL